MRHDVGSIAKDKKLLTSQSFCFYSVRIIGLGIRRLLTVLSLVTLALRTQLNTVNSSVLNIAVNTSPGPDDPVRPGLRGPVTVIGCRSEDP